MLFTAYRCTRSKYFDEIKAFHDKWDKPIFGELGIPPYSNSPEQPHNAFGDLGEYNESIQSNWFEAWVRAFQTQEWWLGYSIYTIADEKSVYNVMVVKQRRLFAVNHWADNNTA